MAELRLEDIAGFFIAGGIIVIGLIGILLLYVLWPQICLFMRALTWRSLPALSSWYQQSKAQAVNYFNDPLYHNQSSEETWDDDDQPVAVNVQQNNNATTTDCNALRDNNALLLQQQAAALAKLVKAGVIGETKGLQIVFGVKPSSTSTKYQEARDALKAELELLDPPARTTPIAGRRTHAKFADTTD